MSDSARSSLKSPSLPSGTEEVRQALRTRALEDLYFFAKAVMAYGLPEAENKLAAIHQTAAGFLAQTTCPKHPEGCRRKFVALPRGHLKTTLGSKAYPIWRYLRNNNVRILLANRIAENAEAFLKEIKAQFEDNALFQWLFPEAVPDVKRTTWTTQEILLPRSARWSENTIETIGVGGSKVSQHYDLIIIDDPVGLEDIYSVEVMAKIVEWFKYLVGLLNDPERGEIVVIGNRWARNDVGGHILENCPDYDTLVRPAIMEGKPLWPERFTAEGLDKLLEDLGPKIFSAQYMNDPLAGNPAAFEKDWLRYYTLLPLGLRKVTICDPALGETAASDYTAIGTLGMDKDRNIFLVDYSEERYGVDELCEEIVRQFMVHRPASVGLETIFFQKVLLWPLREAMRRHNVSIPITPLKGGTARSAKIARISLLQPYYARGQFFWPRHGTERLLKEYLAFPDPTEHDDGLDMLSYGVQLLTAPAAHEIPADNPLSYESIQKDLKTLREETAGARGPWTWHKVAR